MISDKETLEYWDDILKSEGLGDYDELIEESINSVGQNIISIIEDIDDIKGDIEFIDKDFLFKFYYEGRFIGIIEYSKLINNEIYIDMIGNINADEKDFMNYDFKERYNFEKQDIKIKGLIYFMYETFFNSLKSRGYNLAFGGIENKNLYYVNDQLVNKGIIKKSYTRINKNKKEELVREF